MEIIAIFWIQLKYFSILCSRYSNLWVWPVGRFFVCWLKQMERKTIKFTFLFFFGKEMEYWLSEANSISICSRSNFYLTHDYPFLSNKHHELNGVCEFRCASVHVKCFVFVVFYANEWISIRTNWCILW